MNSFETFLLKFIQAAAPTVENLFIHNQRSIVVFNATDALFNGVVDAVAAQQSAPATPATPQTPAPTN